MPFVYQHPDYWHVVAKETKRSGDMINSRKLFDDSEKAHLIQEEEFIKVENIKGKLLLIGAEDDVLWDAATYIRRMEERLQKMPCTCQVEAVVYEYGTYFVFPESMLQTMIPVLGDGFVKLCFQAAKKYPKECRETQMDIDQRVRKTIAQWLR